jgi:hypothetical protein
MPTVYTEVEVDVDLADFATEDLLEELEERGKIPAGTQQDLIKTIYEKKRNGKDYSYEVDELIYTCIGRISLNE